jgi:hypothetical protein
MNNRVLIKLFLFQGTFPGFQSLTERTFHGKFKLLANIPYKEMTLKSKDGKNILGQLDGGMILMSSNV